MHNTHSVFKIAFITLLPAILSGCLSSSPTTSGDLSHPTIADLQVVDCLLPGQVRQLGNKASYLTARRPVNTTAADCRIRGGEYVAYDRANLKSSLNVWMPSAQLGDAKAQANVGEIFERGIGGSPNYEAAVIWYTKAAVQGNSRAQFNLGTLYEQGFGVAKSKKTALDWYRKAWGLSTDTLIYQSTADSQQQVLAASAGREQQALRNRLQGQISAKSSQLGSLNNQVQLLQSKLQSQTNTSNQVNADKKAQLAALAKREAQNKRETQQQLAQSKLKTQRLLAQNKLESQKLLATKQLLAQKELQAQQLQSEQQQQQNALETKALQAKNKLEAQKLQQTQQLLAQHKTETERLQARNEQQAAQLLEQNSNQAQALQVGNAQTQQLQAQVSQLQDQIATLEKEKANSEQQITQLPVFRQPASATAQLASTNSPHKSLTTKGLKFGRYFALVIGNQNYKSLDNLSTPKRDAQEVANVLESKYGFSVQLLLDASNIEVMKAINNLNSVLGEDDNLLIFYAGHGSRVQNGATEEGYWLPVNAEQPPADTFWVSNEFVTRHLSRLKAKRILVVADSCYAGLLSSAPGYLFMGDDQSQSEEYLKYKLAKKSRLILSSGGDKPVLDNAGQGNSVFARAFLQVLKSNDQIMAGPQLFLKLRDRVARGAKVVGYDQVPEFKAIKGAGHEVGDFFFVPTS